jgi:hypothetical protein
MRPRPGQEAEAEKEVENRRLPKYQGLKEGKAPEAFDPVIQSWAPQKAMPAPVQNWEGISNLDGVLPPDPTGAVGPNDYIVDPEKSSLKR